MDEPETQTVFVRDRRSVNPYRQPFLILVVALCLGLLSQSFSSWQTWRVAHNTNVVVNDVKFRNSPENAAAQAAFVDEIILRVDCNAVKAIEDGLNRFALENPGLRFEVSSVPKKCKDKTTTTTTTQKQRSNR